MKAENSERKVLISSKVPQELEEKLRKVAEDERRTVSNVVFLLLETHPRLQPSQAEVLKAA